MKRFDCVEMKREGQERIYRETQGLSREEELAYYEHAAAEFWLEIGRLREEIAGGRRVPPVVAGK